MIEATIALNTTSTWFCAAVLSTGTGNTTETVCTGSEDVDTYPDATEGRTIAERAAIAVALAIVIAVTVAGNLLVAVTILTIRRLHNPTNCFIASLAVSDLLLGCLVLPFSASATVADPDTPWPLGSIICNIYVSCDVMLCTVSILTLFAISLDRYVAVTAPYRYRRTVSLSVVQRVNVAVWLFSAAMAFVPIHLGWNSPDGRVQNVGDPTRCVFALNRPYVLLIAVGTYFTPLVVMSGVYLRILQITKRQVTYSSARR